VKRVLSAESAVLLHFEPVGVVLLVLHGVVVPLLAFGTSESDFNAHYGTSLTASLYHRGYSDLAEAQLPSAAEKERTKK
jgi:hypothetical protein